MHGYTYVTILWLSTAKCTLSNELHEMNRETLLHGLYCTLTLIHNFTMGW